MLFLRSCLRNSVGLIRAIDTHPYKPKMAGAAMIGPQNAQVEAKLGPLLNGVLNYEDRVPAPALAFKGVAELMSNSEARHAGTDLGPLGHFRAPPASAQRQVGVAHQGNRAGAATGTPAARSPGQPQGGLANRKGLPDSQGASPALPEAVTGPLGDPPVGQAEKRTESAPPPTTNPAVSGRRPLTAYESHALNTIMNARGLTCSEVMDELADNATVWLLIDVIALPAGGSVCLNRVWTSGKRMSALVMPPPGLAMAVELGSIEYLLAKRRM